MHLNTGSNVTYIKKLEISVKKVCAKSNFLEAIERHPVHISCTRTHIINRLQEHCIDISQRNRVPLYLNTVLLTSIILYLWEDIRVSVIHSRVERIRMQEGRNMYEH